MNNNCLPTISEVIYVLTQYKNTFGDLPVLLTSSYTNNIVSPANHISLLELGEDYGNEKSIIISNSSLTDGEFCSPYSFSAEL